LERFRVDARKVQVIHNGVAWGQMQSDFSVWSTVKDLNIQTLGLKRGVLQLLFIGHGFQRKGLDLLLSALRALNSADIHLSVIGHDKHLTRYKAQNHDLPVTFFGPRADTHLFYQLADALIIPSLYDPFANVTVEALAMGLHVISSKHNGGHEVLTPETGMVTDLSAEALVDALQRIRPKTKESAQTARHSVAHLELATQMSTLVEACGG
jgi:UDP-glucose:(heptosyl)LPS alpha-1,3-glucosyltransferase